MQKVLTMSPLDIVILLKIIIYRKKAWSQILLSEELGISQSEISKSLKRSKFAGLLDPSGKIVRRLALMDFLQYGIRYVFPQRPGPIVRGIPTAHSAEPLNEIVQSEEQYVWPAGNGKVRGQAIIPLYSSVVSAVKNDEELYQILALIDSIRVGRAREKELAIIELKKRILDAE